MATSTDRNRTRTDSIHPSQAIALAVGVAYTLVGIAGFFVTGFDDFAGHDTGETLLGFELNPLHNIVHLVIGLAGLAMWRRLDTARTFGWLLFIGYGAAFVYGILVDKTSEANFLSLNGADDGLHLASALVGLVIALWPERDRNRNHRDTAAGARTR
jgi:uncharacterized membrane protein YuzA (DUF378 family)